MDQKTLYTLSQQFGTPLYVFDLDAFARRIRQVKAAFGPDIRLCYSMKANPFLLRNLPSELERLEVCSLGELNICHRVGADMSRVILSGVNKTRENVIKAMEWGVGTFTAESRLHLEYLNEYAAQAGRTVPVLLRLTSDNQFGIDEPELRELVKNRAHYPNVEMIGLHYFSGTQKKRVTLLGREMEKLEQLLCDIEAESGLRMEQLEYGAGLWIDYFGEDPEAAELALLEEAAPVLRQEAQKRRLTVEMGRYYTAPCGTYLTTVMDQKTNCGFAYAICDGGIHQMNYDGQVKGMQVPPLAVLNPGTGEARDWTLCGSLCTPGDVMVRRAALAGVEPGSVLAFGRTGAYSICEGMAMLLSRDLPAVVLYSEAEGAKLARDHFDLDPLNTPEA